MSIQVAILKVLASHGSGRATLDSLNRDLAILSASGPDWQARIKRLASRVPTINIFSSGYVTRDADGWGITEAGRAFLRALEAVTQDNLTPVPVPSEAMPRAPGALLIAGHGIRVRTRFEGDPEHVEPDRRRPLSERR